MMEQKPQDKKKKWLTYLRWGGTLLSLALFIWLISRQKWDVVLDKAAHIAPWAFAAVIVLYLLSYAFNTLRWCFLLWAQGTKISLWQAYRLNWAGYFASNFLPSTIGGDGFRMLAVHPYTGRKSVSIGSVALDRLINMAAMICLLPVPLFMFGKALGAMLTGQAAAGSALALIPARLNALVEKYAPKLASAVKMWATNPLSFVYAFLAAWPSNLLPIAATYLLASQLGMHVSYWQVLSVQTVSYFLSLLPISVNGYGLREVAYTTLYASLGATLEQASTLALITRFSMVLCTIPGALWLSNSVTDNLEE